MKKKIFSLLLMVFLIVPAFMFVTACGGDDSGKLDEKVIKNWTDYTAIGVGSVSEEIATDRTFKGNNNLIGKKSDGSFEVVELVNDEGKTIKTNLYLSGFTAYENFIFVNCNNEDNGENVKAFSYGEGDFSYIIDSNGKMHLLSDIFSYMNLSQKGYCESDTSIYVTGAKKSNSEYCYYRIYVEKGKLTVKKILAVSKYSSTGFFVDKFDNVFLLEKGTITDKTYTEEMYLLKQGETVVKLSTKKDKKSAECSLYKALNGQVYFKPNASVEEYKTFDKTGELIDTLLFVAPTNYYTSENLIKSGKDVKYYYGQTTNASGTSSTLEIVKVTETSKTTYSVESVATKTTSKFVVGNDKIYFLNAQGVSYIDLDTGNEINISTDYTINNIWSDNQGNVCYSGKDYNQNDIEGTIKGDGNLSTSITSNGFDIAYIKTL